MQGHHLHLLPQVNSSLQEQGRSHGSSSSGAMEGGSREKDTRNNEAGTTQEPHMWQGCGEQPRQSISHRTARASFQQGKGLAGS